jgi:hypothetical protein
MIRLQLSEQQALHLLAALEALEALPTCLEAPYGRLLVSGRPLLCASKGINGNNYTVTVSF